MKNVTFKYLLIQKEVGRQLKWITTKIHLLADGDLQLNERLLSLSISFVATSLTETSFCFAVWKQLAHMEYFLTRRSRDRVLRCMKLCAAFTLVSLANTRDLMEMFPVTPGSCIFLSNCPGYGVLRANGSQVSNALRFSVFCIRAGVMSSSSEEGARVWKWKSSCNARHKQLK